MTDRVGQLVFLAAFVAALAFYALTAPSGIPWSESSHLALAYLGEIEPLPVMPYPVWGCYVQVFGGATALSAFMAALAAGLLATVVNRHLGWRPAVGAAVVWTFIPWVWNCAVTGQRSVCLAAMAVVVMWALNAVALSVMRKVLVGRIRPNRIVGWAAIGAAVAFAVVSATRHDYRLGEPANAYARDVVEQADGRIIVMNGVCDDQVIAAARSKGVKTVSLRNDDASRTNLCAWVRSAFPAETNLWVAVQIGASTFAEAASKAHPERFHRMDGRTTTFSEWERRWMSFKPYLDSRDPFVPVGRRMFGYEGNCIANAMADAARGRDELAGAWRLYWRIYEEVDPGNISALVNMREMARRGYEAGGNEKVRMQRKLDAFLGGRGNRRRLRELVRTAGPVRADLGPEAKMSDEAKKRIAEQVAAGEGVKIAPGTLALQEWNDEMAALADKGELVKAGRLARTILSNPEWRSFVPANAVMGSVTVREGDYVAGERFLRVAMNSTNAVPATVLNDYADVLLRFGRLDEAEVTARRAVDAADANFWAARLTLAEVLVKKSKRKGGDQKKTMRNAGDEESWGESRWEQDPRGEINALLKIVLARAPERMRGAIRSRYKEFVR